MQSGAIGRVYRLLGTTSGIILHLLRTIASNIAHKEALFGQLTTSRLFSDVVLSLFVLNSIFTPPRPSEVFNSFVLDCAIQDLVQVKEGRT